MKSHDTALSLLGDLLDRASWYFSAIELPRELDGEELEREAGRIVRGARINTAAGMDPERPTADLVIPLARRIYERHPTGCCLHIVLDDENLEDGQIEFCAARAHESGHALCAAVALLMRAMSKTQRRRVVRALDQREDGGA